MPEPRREPHSSHDRALAGPAVVLADLIARVRTARRTHIGFPAAQDMDWSAVSALTGTLLNNCGSPRRPLN